MKKCLREGCKEMVNDRRKYCSHSCNAKANNPLKLGKRVGLSDWVELPDKPERPVLKTIEELRKAISNMEMASVWMLPSPIVSREEQERLERKEYFRKHKSCVIEKDGRTYYGDKEGYLHE